MRLILINRKKISKLKKNIRKLLLVIGGIIISLGCAFPIFWLLTTSFKGKEEIFANPPTMIPMDWTLDHYITLFQVTQFLNYAKNSIIVSTSATIIGLFVAILAVYSLSRFKFKGSRWLTVMLLFSYMVPQILIIIPFMKFFIALKIVNSLVGLTFVFVSITLPFSVWMLRSYIETIPIELEEAAMVEGCTRFAAFYRVILPAAVPGMIATFVFTFIIAWNEYIYSLILIQSESNKTISLGLAILTGSSKAVYSYGMLSAGGVLAIVPLLIFFSFIQRHLVGGFTAGAVKG